MTQRERRAARLPARAYAVAACAVLFLLLAQAVGHSWVRIGHLWFADGIPLHLRLSTGGSWDSAAIDALRAWNGAGARFQFSWGRYASGRASCSAANGDHDVIWSYSSCPGTPWGRGTVAVAWTWRNTVTGEALDSDVVFNLNRDWDVYDGPARYDAVDFRRVALHEFGHVLGLDHPDDHGQFRDAIMNSTVSDLDRLQSDDISGIRGLYGSEPPTRGTPDLVVESLQTSPRTLTVGESFTLSARVRNIGDGDAVATTLRYYYYRSSSEGWVVVGSDRVGGLPASTGRSESIRLTAPTRAGTHYYNACVASVAGERNEDNCAGSLRVTVTGGAGAPDLVVDPLQTSPGTLTAGEAFTLSTRVRNVGSGAAAATTLRYYYYQASSKDWVAVGSDRVGGLPASTSRSESIVLTAPTRAGTHYYNACVESVAGERNEDNCSGNLRVTVTGGGGAPDLVVDPLRTSPGTLTAGATFTLSTRVRNVGSGAAAATTLRYYYYRSSDREWVVVGQDHVGGLPASTSRSESIALTAPARAGTHYYNACVASVAGERNEDNCSGNLRVTVR
ncbi:MAG: matrixin family metalloprotease [Acidobacteria bacterium]|nr:matrixin family metalloprotease [Acidobacteriota bacterium]